LDVVITARTASGDPDLFVSSGPPLTLAELQRKTDWPSRERSMWHSTFRGSDQLTIPRGSAGCGAGPCTYYITVYAATCTGYQIETTLRVTPTTRRAIPLRSNVVLLPLSAWLPAGETLFFTVELIPDPYAPPGAMLRFENVDADLYASFTGHWPSGGGVGSHVWYPATGNTAQSCAIYIGAKDVPQPLPATLYIAVRAIQNSYFSLHVDVPRGSAPVTLVPGQPQRGSVRADQRAWFTFTPEASSTGGFTFTVAPISGKMDLFVSPVLGFQSDEWRTCAHPRSGGPRCTASVLWNNKVDAVTIAPEARSTAALRGAGSHVFTRCERRKLRGKGDAEDWSRGWGRAVRSTAAGRTAGSRESGVCHTPTVTFSSYHPLPPSRC
jgi:hypothetical protein